MEDYAVKFFIGKIIPRCGWTKRIRNTPLGLGMFGARTHALNAIEICTERIYIRVRSTSHRENQYVYYVNVPTIRQLLDLFCKEDYPSCNCKIN